MRSIHSLFLALLPLTPLLPAQDPILRDAECGNIGAQYGQHWAADDGRIEQILADARERDGGIENLRPETVAMLQIFIAGLPKK